MQDDPRYEEAKKHVHKLKGFYIHLWVYILVNLGLIFINLLTSRDTIWFIYPLFGWGIGLVGHVFSILNFGNNWENRQIEKYMNNKYNK